MLKRIRPHYTHEQQIARAMTARRVTDPISAEGKFRQKYHFMAPSGWINDPNGLIYWRGEYHLFYQHNPYGSIWSSMHWGHAVSSDLVHWRHLPIALAPSEPYDLSKNGGCFSGSAVDNNGVLTLMYTSAIGGEEKNGGRQTQSLATSKDGITFKKYEGNPVIPKPPPEHGSIDFRDPKLWKRDNTWYVVLGTCAPGKQKGKIVLYKSLDLFNWDYIGIIADNTEIGGTMWECPDFSEINGKWVLFFSPEGFEAKKTMYLVGDFDWETHKYNWTTKAEVDQGLDFYAPQTFLDSKGNRVLVGWVDGSAEVRPTASEKWTGHLTVPRRLVVNSNSRVQFIPVDELKILRTTLHIYKDVIVKDGEKLALSAGNGVNAELIIIFDLTNTTAEKIQLDVRVGEKEFTRVELNLKDSKILFDRDKSGSGVLGNKEIPLEDAKEPRLLLHVFLDTSSIEFFTDDYRTVFSANIFPSPESNGISLGAIGGDVSVVLVEAFGITSIW